MKQSKVIMALIALISFSVSAQQDAQYTNYMYNTINVNPAYAGSRGSMSIFGLHRTQWVGIDGAPNTNAFSINTPLSNSKVGLGVSFINESIGVINENKISIDFSYTLDLNHNGSKLNFGLKGTANILDVAYSELVQYNPNDPQFQQDIKSQFTPNFGVGVYWHNKSSYVGLSMPNLLETTRFDNNIQSTMQQKMHYYFMGGHVFEINPVLKFKPAVLFKAISGAPLQTDLSANFLMHDKLTLGAAYRFDAAWSALIGFQVTDGMFVGYSYDAETSKLANYNSGSHEVFLRFELFNKYKKISAPRFF